jgi:hypothetical protein
MSNEPVAWMLIRNESCVEVTEWYGVMRGWEEFLGDNEKIVELYTHPAKEQLTDEEIFNLEQQAYNLAMQVQNQKAEIEALKASHIELERGIVKDLNQRQSAEPLAWMNEETLECGLCWQGIDWEDIGCIPLYTHPVKEQLSNGHLSDCAIHNEPALRNKPCDCGFEPKFKLSGLKHEDNCRYFDDGEFCTCGAEDSALVEWYRHKEVTHPVKEHFEDEPQAEELHEILQSNAELTDEEIGDFTHRMVLCCGVNPNSADINVLGLKFIVEDILRKAQEKW